MNTQTPSRAMTGYQSQEWLYVGLLIAAILVMPKELERVQFLLILIIPIALSTKYFNFDLNKWKTYALFLAIFLTGSLVTFYVHVWQLRWEIENPSGLFGVHLKIDQWLYAIPFNDGMWLRQFHHPLLENAMIYIYMHAFVVCLLALVIYFILTGQPKKIIHAMLAGHFLQYVLILPFHFWVDGHQVWWIQNQFESIQFMDPLRGYRSLIDPIVPSMNHVFPSMHTSIAFVTILIALRQKSIAIRHFFVIINVVVIISTVYLGIHWVIDIIGGLIFGYLVLKLADWIMQTKWMENKLNKYV